MVVKKVGEAVAVAEEILVAKEILVAEETLVVVGETLVAEEALVAAETFAEEEKIVEEVMVAAEEMAVAEAETEAREAEGAVEAHLHRLMRMHASIATGQAMMRRSALMALGVCPAERRPTNSINAQHSTRRQPCRPASQRPTHPLLTSTLSL